MAPVSLLNPAFLPALGLAGLPILLHLLRKQTYTTVQWAAWDFLALAKVRRRRRIQLHELLVLALRVLAIAAIVLALCRPRLAGFSAPGAAADRVEAVIALDASGSMGYRSGNTTLFSLGQQASGDLLTHVLGPGDTASAVLFGTTVQPIVPRPSSDLATVRSRLLHATVSDSGTRYDCIPTAVRSYFAAGNSGNRYLYIITDSQLSGIGRPGPTADSRSEWAQLERMTHIVWVSVGSAFRPNVSIDTPELASPLTTTSVPAAISANVHNYTRQARTLTVQLIVDHLPAATQSVSVQPFTANRVTVRHLFLTPGLHACALRVGANDGLAGDDTAWLTVNVRALVHVLVVEPTQSADSTLNEGFYLEKALAPSQGHGTFEVRTITPPALNDVTLAHEDLVAMTGIDTMPETAATALGHFVQAGGGLLIFPGPHTNPITFNRTYARVLQPNSGSDEPAGLLAAPGDKAPPGSVPSFDHYAAGITRDLPPPDPTDTRIGGLLRLAPSHHTAQLLYRLAGGQPGVSGCSVGAGRVALSAFPAGTAGGNFPFTPTYPALIHLIASWLAAPQNATEGLHVGDPLSFQLAGTHSQTSTIYSPRGKPIRLLPTRDTIGDYVRLAQTSEAGIYGCTSPRREWNALLAVNWVPAESQLGAMDANGVRAALKPANPTVVEYGPQFVNSLHTLSRGTNLFPWFIALAVLLLTFESIASGSRRGAR